MFDYGHCHRSVFCERQCNFRLALMYFKSFLFPFPPQKPHILLVVLLCITYDHTHLKVDMHPNKTIHPEIILLVRIFECRIQIH